MTTIDSAINTSPSYSLNDNSQNISAASSALLNGATNVTATHDGAGGNVFEMDNLTSTSTLNALTITGDAAVDVVELSAALTQSGKALC